MPFGKRFAKISKIIFIPCAISKFLGNQFFKINSRIGVSPLLLMPLLAKQYHSEPEKPQRHRPPAPLASNYHLVFQ
jgi:hypothetical protein